MERKGVSTAKEFRARNSLAPPNLLPMLSTEPTVKKTFDKNC